MREIDVWFRYASFRAMPFAIRIFLSKNFAHSLERKIRLDRGMLENVDILDPGLRQWVVFVNSVIRATACVCTAAGGGTDERRRFQRKKCHEPGVNLWTSGAVTTWVQVSKVVLPEMSAVQPKVRLQNVPIIILSWPALRYKCIFFLLQLIWSRFARKSAQYRLVRRHSELFLVSFGFFWIIG